MNRYIDILENLLSFEDEYEWFDYKENWFDKDGIGEYISALSNGAALCGKEYGYLVWGISDKEHNIVGSDINLNKNIDNEPYEHYLARNLKPGIYFETIEFNYTGKRIVMMIIDCAKSSPTKFKNETFIRIGSSKENIKKYPEWEMKLNSVLSNGYPTIVNNPAPDYAQDLTFSDLFVYFKAKGIELKEETFIKSLKLKTKDNKFNIMAYLLSDQNNIPCRLSYFLGRDKTSTLYIIKEFGNRCLFYTIDKILEYGEILNINQIDETNRKIVREEKPLFDYAVFREAILNAFIHNKWLTLNAPAISIFDDRIEIISHGGLCVDQDIEGFYSGTSLPVNEVLASLFLQLRISERSGRGVPKIIGRYGRNSIKIEKNRVTVIIPFEKIENEARENNIFYGYTNEYEDKPLNNRDKVLKLIEEKPNIKVKELAQITGLSEIGIKKLLKILKDDKCIARVGANKNGHWEILNKGL